MLCLADLASLDDFFQWMISVVAARAWCRDPVTAEAGFVRGKALSALWGGQLPKPWYINPFGLSTPIGVS